MEALDGNAVAGPLQQYFGTEMTIAIGACAHCGARARIAELRVYGRAPGTVVRCASCGGVVIAIVEARGAVRVDIRDFRLDEPPASASQRAQKLE